VERTKSLRYEGVCLILEEVLIGMIGGGGGRGGGERMFELVGGEMESFMLGEGMLGLIGGGMDSFMSSGGMGGSSKEEMTSVEREGKEFHGEEGVVGV